MWRFLSDRTSPLVGLVSPVKRDSSLESIIAPSEVYPETGMDQCGWTRQTQERSCRHVSSAHAKIDLSKREPPEDPQHRINPNVVQITDESSHETSKCAKKAKGQAKESQSGTKDPWKLMLSRKSEKL